jgi:small subunit ribosomal protein S6
MKQYELLVVLPGTVEESEVPTMIGDVKSIVEKHGGENIMMQNRGKSRLAYPIRHIRYGYFHIIQFTAEGEGIPEMQKELALMRELLRSLITSFDPKERADTQKKLGRKEEGPMRTLASVFERFGGEVKKTEILRPTKLPVEQNTPVVPTTTQADKVEVVEVAKEEEITKVETETTPESVVPAEDKQEGEKPVVKLEDIDKKLDQLLEDDLKQV